MDPITEEEKKGGGGGGILEFSRDIRPGALKGIDKPYSNNAYPDVAYCFYQIRDPDPANLARLRDGDFNLRVVEHFKGATRGKELTPQDCKKYRSGRIESTIDDGLHWRGFSNRPSSCGT